MPNTPKKFSEFPDSGQLYDTDVTLISRDGTGTYKAFPLSIGEYVLTKLGGTANHFATLGPDGKLLVGQRPAQVTGETFVVASQAAMLALAAPLGSTAVRTDLSKTFVLSQLPASTLANWVELLFSVPVPSVFGRTGAIGAMDGDYNTDQITELTKKFYANALVDTHLANPSATKIINKASLDAVDASNISVTNLSIGLATAVSTTLANTQAMLWGNTTSNTVNVRWKKDASNTYDFSLVGANTNTTFSNVGLGFTDATKNIGVLNVGKGNNTADASGNAVQMAFLFNGTSGGGFAHLVQSNHHNVAGADNWVRFYVNSSTTSTGSTAPGTGNRLSLEINGAGGSLPGSWSSDKLFLNAGANAQNRGKLTIGGGATGAGVGTVVQLGLELDTGGFSHYLRTRHSGTLTDTLNNAFELYLNNSTTVSGSSAAGTGSTKRFEVNNGGGLLPGGWNADKLNLKVAANSKNYGLVNISGGNDSVDTSNNLAQFTLEYLTGGFTHFIQSGHTGVASSPNNWIRIYLNSSATQAGSTAPGTGNRLAIDINGTGGSLPGAWSSTNFSTTGTIAATGAITGSSTLSATGDITTSGNYRLGTDGTGFVCDSGGNKRTGIMKMASNMMCFVTNSSSTSVIKVGYVNNVDLTAAGTFTATQEFNAVSNYFRPFTTNTGALGGPSNIWANLYATTVRTTSLLLSGTATAATGVIGYDSATSSFRGYNGTAWVDFVQGSYSDAQARSAIATGTYGLSGVDTNYLADGSFTNNKQLNLYVDETIPSVKSKYKTSTGAYLYQEFASVGEPSAFSTLGVGYNNQLANSALLTVGGTPTSIPTMPTASWPAIFNYPSTGANAGFNASSIGTMLAPKTVAVFALNGVVGYTDANIAKWDVGAYEKSGTAMHTSLSLRLSHDLGVEGNVTPTQFIFRSGGQAGFGDTTTPRAWVSIGGGEKSGFPATASNQMSFSVTNASGSDSGWAHFVKTYHSATFGSGNAMFFYLNTSINSFSSSAPGTGNDWAFGIDNDRMILGGALHSRNNGSNNIGTSTNRFGIGYLAGGVVTTSDIRLKKDITEAIMGSMSAKFASPLAFLSDTRVIRYKLLEDAHDSIGFDARELYANRFPGARVELADKDGKSRQLAFGEYEELSDEDKDDASFFIKDGSMTAMNTAAIKQMSETINLLIAKVSHLETKSKHKH